MRRMDKLCLISVAALVVLAAGVLNTAVIETDQQALESAPPQQAIEIPAEQFTTLAAMPIAVTLEPPETPQFREDIPLDLELQVALRDTCETNGVPVSLALGLIEVESNFVPDADNGLCYGLFQLNRRYFPDGLSPADNINAGIAHLAAQIRRYDGDISAALRAYNRGYDDGDRAYANAVLAAAERWENSK